MTNGQRCHGLTILDDHSRFSLCLDAKENERWAGTKASLDLSLIHIFSFCFRKRQGVLLFLDIPIVPFYACEKRNIRAGLLKNGGKIRRVRL